uniref:Reverse transcriptase domain-containing protein n=1 Tax=Angiostrongylus cantonensis TaxID=6313 RepID=A0A0K0D073_ANGCA
MAILENVTRTLEWDNTGVKIDVRQLQELRFTDDITVMTPNINQGKQMIADLDKACRKNGLRLDLTKSMFMRNGLFTYAQSQWKEYLRMLQLRLSRPRNQHDERLNSIVEQKETRDLGSLQEH